MKKSLLLLTLLAFMVGHKLFAQVPPYVPTNGLLAWYGFNSSPNDDSGNNNHAVNNGATYYNDRFGNVGAAGYFNGTNAHMVVQTPSFTFSDTGDFTYSFWINKEVQPAAGIVLMTGVNTSGVFITIFQGGSQSTYGTNKQQSAWAYINCPHTLNVWDHYVCTYNSSAMNLYKNGVLQSSGTYPYTNATAVNVPLYIGKGIASGNFLGGIDDIGIWGRELSSTEVLDLYNNSVTGTQKIKSALGKLSVFPNPAGENIQLKLNAGQSNESYQIIDAMGKTIMSGLITTERLNLSTHELMQGMYIVRLSSGEQV